VLGLLRGDEREPHRWCFAKKAAAFLRCRRPPGGHFFPGAVAPAPPERPSSARSGPASGRRRCRRRVARAAWRDHALARLFRLSPLSTVAALAESTPAGNTPTGRDRTRDACPGDRTRRATRRGHASTRLHHGLELAAGRETSDLDTPVEADGFNLPALLPPGTDRKVLTSTR
jgi:hypothetical protein